MDKENEVVSYLKWKKVILFSYLKKEFLVKDVVLLVELFV